jgi:hypothetical protein
MWRSIVDGSFLSSAANPGDVDLPAAVCQGTSAQVVVHVILSRPFASVRAGSDGKGFRDSRRLRIPRSFVALRRLRMTTFEELF